MDRAAKLSVATHGKSPWPELLDVKALPAVTVIAHERPDVTVELLPPGSTTIPGFDPLRVRVFINYDILVSQVPVIG